ncbi:hypothetical protein TPENAI_61154 [Tenacibaculum litopenaei]|uniref:hypothetical protein n=1 Tax=Tenacibaculum litopenaei TaxID=396016 RepID=UPI0038967193
MKILITLTILFLSTCQKSSTEKFKVLRIHPVAQDLYWVYIEDIIDSKLYRITSIKKEPRGAEDVIKEGEIIKLRLEKSKKNIKFKDSRVFKNNRETSFQKDFFKGRKVALNYYSPCLNGLGNMCN